HAYGTASGRRDMGQRFRRLAIWPDEHWASKFNRKMEKAMTQNWFTVDKAGLGRQAEQHSKGRLIGELVQNALDEAGVTTINITLAQVPARPLADLTVEDD